MLLSCVWALVLAAPGHAQDVVLRYSEWIPPTHTQNARVIRPYLEEISEVTEGRVVVEISSAPLGPPPRNYQLVADGIADMAWGVHGFTPGVFPASELVELPFHSTNSVANSVAYWKVFKEYLEPAGMHSGVHTLAMHTQVPGQIFNSVRAIEGPDDLTGLKIRATNNAVGAALNKLGATPVGMPVTEMRDALEKGIVDGVSLSNEGLYNFGIEEFVDYEMRVPGGLYNVSMFLVVNQAKWDQISPEDQAAIMEISGEAFSRRIGEVWQEEQDKYEVKSREDGLTVTEVDGDFLAYVEDKLGSSDADWIAKMEGGKLKFDAAAALARYRELSKQ